MVTDDLLLKVQTAVCFSSLNRRDVKPLDSGDKMLGQFQAVFVATEPGNPVQEV